jgi:hypothetical protein
MSIVRMFSFGSLPEPTPTLDASQIKLIRDSWSAVENAGLQESGLVVFTR